MSIVTIAGRVSAEKLGRQERKARETRRRILEAARELFLERGIDAVTVDEIAARADFSRGTVFNYFSTKESICQGLGELQAEKLMDAVESGRISGPTAGEKIEQALRFLAEMPGHEPERCREMLMRALASIKPGEMPEHRKRIFQLLETWAEEGQQTGEFRADLPPCQLACFIMGLQLQATLVWSYGLAGGSLPDHLSKVLRIGLEGMQARK